jgi:putative nucleotidyltransferase with HDIG domain
LLVKIDREIPGTSTHGALVGCAAAFAAHAIGANADICRIAGNFHDAAKLEHPQFYPEAIYGSRLRPMPLASRRDLAVVLHHPRKSAEILAQYRVPPEIRRAVLEHHGTRKTRIKVTDSLRAQLREEDFRYKGPKPSSKEAAILMIADSAEARVHGLMRREEAKLNGFPAFLMEVRSVGRELRNGRVEGERRIDDPQFNRSGLTPTEQDIVEFKIAEILFRFYSGMSMLGTPLRKDGTPAFANGGYYPG